MIMFGTAGWEYNDWYGFVYPQSRSVNFNTLEFLVNYLDTIEINSSFYFPPSPYTTKKWARTASFKKGFVFTVKLWEKFTHKLGTDVKEDVKLFRKALEPLKDEGKFGALLIQFPWSFAYSKENLNYIRKLASQFREYNPCVELRNLLWLRPELLNLFKGEGIGFVNIDQPDAKGALKRTDIVTSKIGYLRLHGRNSKNWFKKNALRHERYDYLYNRDELNELSQLAGEIAKKAKTTFAITNNHYLGSAFKNIIELKHLVTKEKIRIPRSVLSKFPDLKNIASSIDNTYSPKQGELFSDV